MTTLWAALLWVALLPPGGSPEIVIRGRIVDSAGAVIAGARVRVLDEASRQTIDSTASDAEGKFSFGGLDAGNYLLAVSAPGFAEKLVRVDQPQSGVTQGPTIRLEVLDCDAPHVNCDIFTTGDYSDPYPVILTRDLTISASQAIDLKKGELVTPDSGTADIRLDAAAGGLFVVPVNGAAFTTAGEKRSCGKTRNKDPLRIDGLGSASEFVVLTVHKQCSRLFLTSEIPPGADQAGFHIVTRSR